MTKSIGKNL